MADKPRDFQELVTRWETQRDEQVKVIDDLRQQIQSERTIAADLHHQVTQISGEIAALQTEAAKADRPWYKTHATVIALLALVLSLASTITSELRARYQAAIATRTELSSVLGRLNDFAAQYADLQQRYPDDPQRVINMFGPRMGESRTYAEHALELLKQIEAQGGPVDALELNVVAGALYTVGLMDDCLVIAKRATESSKNFDDQIVALRFAGAAHFGRREVEDGRKYFTKADALQSPPGVPPQNALMQRYQTNLFWAQSEAMVGNAQQALARLDAAEAILPQLLIPRTQVDAYKADINRFRGQIPTQPAPAS